MTSSVSSVASTATSTHQPIIQKEEYTYAGIVLQFFKEKVKDLAKGLGYITFWVGQAVPDAPAGVQSFSKTMGEFKNFVSATEIPQKIADLVEACKDLWAKKTAQAGREVFKKSTALVNSSVDGIDFGSRFVPVDAGVMTWLKGLNFAATLGGAGVGAAEQVNNLVHTSDRTKQILYMVNLARDVSYAALGALGLFFVVTATPMVPWMIVALLTSGLTFTIGGYFYEKINDPEGKGKNLNPDIVIKNNMARAQQHA